MRSGTNTAAYSYLANSPLVSQIFLTNGSAWRMTTTKTYDHLDRLLGISSVSSAPSVVSYGYSYNAANQRTTRLEADNSRWHFGYDSLGQVVSGKRYWSDGVPTAGQQFEYAFDDIGNRTGTKAGGDENGANLRSAFYHASSLNQYTNREVPGAVDVMGVALATSSVTVNNLSVYRKGEYFRKELSVDNSTAPVWPSVSVAATGETAVTRHEYVSRTPEAFVHDEDGNLTQDGRWNYYWDAENRLIAMTNIPGVPEDAKLALTFAYDWQGRRIEKVVYTNGVNGYVASYTNRFVYDGWNLIARLDGAGNLLQIYAWGLDLSGSLQGAGGVRGLLLVSEIANGQISSSYAPAYDGNGNVMALVGLADGAVAARYEYGPFGELLGATYANPLVRESLGGGGFRFSTKYQDEETDILMYPRRPYRDGRFLTRDPIGERGGPNLYAFVLGDPVNRIDPTGLITFTGCSTKQQEQLTQDFVNFCDKIQSRHWSCCMHNYGLGYELRKICDANSLQIICDPTQTGNCKDACGWTHWFRTIDNKPIIHLCPDGITGSDGCPEAGCTIIHEMTHTTNWSNNEEWAQKTEVCAGCPPTDRFPDGPPPWNE